MTIPEIATQMLTKSLSEVSENGSRTLFFVGSKSVGKSTLIYTFLDKPDSPKETLVLEYSFGRKSNQKEGISKTICHVWEYGGKLDLLKNVLTSIPVGGKYYFCIMIDLSKIKTLWNTLEMCIHAVNEAHSTNSPEIIMICGKYDIFKNYDSEIKKIISTTLRCVSILIKGHLMFYSSKDQQLVKRAKDMLLNIGFGAGVAFKEKNTNYTKPLIIPKGADSWETVGVSNSTLEQIKDRYVSRIPSASEIEDIGTMKNNSQKTHPEPVLDNLVAVKYEELRSMESLDMSIDYSINVA